MNISKAIGIGLILIMIGCKEPCQECPERYIPVDCGCKCIGLEVGENCYDSAYMSEQFMFIHDTTDPWCDSFKFLEKLKITGFQGMRVFTPSMSERVQFFRKEIYNINYFMKYVSSDSTSAEHHVAGTYMNVAGELPFTKWYAPGKGAWLQCNLKKTGPKSFDAYFYWRDWDDGTVVSDYCVRRFYQLSSHGRKCSCIKIIKVVNLTRYTTLLRDKK